MWFFFLFRDQGIFYTILGESEGEKKGNGKGKEGKQGRGQIEGGKRLTEQKRGEGCKFREGEGKR
jgi:hypothetical protein